ncbi:MAG: hypothetical protein A2Z25_02025 [Planctomycetes bacterium RBG_16_55_9]|nr:MAG: hypothetical protein A2Z25_02025 [Planctomycetes bacterium RBG_16_55_9]
MLRSVKSLIGYKIGATDGPMGKVDSFLFDDSAWIIRYLVVDTGGWLPGRQVLISPVSLERPVTKVRMMPVNLTREQVENSPDIDTDKPISRQAEIELHKHYDWTPYWIGGGFDAPIIQPSSEEKKQAAVAAMEKADSHLRSTQEVTGYRIHATDGDIGHVEDFVLEDESWGLRYLVVDTKNWLPGRSVLISPQWIEQISWPDSKVWTDLSSEQIKDSPRYDPSAPVNQEYETRLYDYYGRPKDWE